MFRELFLYFVLPFGVFVYFFLKKKFSYFKDRGIAFVEPKWPFGNMNGLGSTRNFFNILLDYYKAVPKNDVVAGFYNFITPIYIIIDPDVARTILIKDFNNFVNRGQFVNEEEEPLTAHLFAIEDDKWRFIRNKLTPVFTSGKLKGMYPIVVNKGDNLVAAIERETKGGKSIEMKDIARRFTLDIISSTAFGMEANTLNKENEKFLAILRKAFADGPIDAVKFFFIIALPNFSKKIHLRMIHKDLSDLLMQIVGGNIKQRETSKENRKDFLGMLIQLKNKGSIDGEFSNDVKKLTLNEIMAQAFLFFFAGSDTSSTTISFALAELSNNQEVQEKLRKEILEKVKETNGEVTYEALNEMNYLNMVVNEALRMYPSGPPLFRVALKDYQVPNSKHVIPKGTQVWINPVGFHYDEKYYKNPTVFNPENFSQEEINKRPNFTFLPFGEGPRNCIGMRFGLLNVKLALIYIIKNFKITPDPKLKFPIEINPKAPFIEAKTGILLKFERIGV